MDYKKKYIKYKNKYLLLKNYKLTGGDKCKWNGKFITFNKTNKQDKDIVEEHDIFEGSFDGFYNETYIGIISGEWIVYKNNLKNTQIIKYIGNNEKIKKNKIEYNSDNGWIERMETNGAKIIYYDGYVNDSNDHLLVKILSQYGLYTKIFDYLSFTKSEFVMFKTLINKNINDVCKIFKTNNIISDIEFNLLLEPYNITEIDSDTFIFDLFLTSIHTNDRSYSNGVKKNYFFSYKIEIFEKDFDIPLDNKKDISEERLKIINDPYSYLLFSPNNNKYNKYNKYNNIFLKLQKSMPILISSDNEKIMYILQLFFNLKINAKIIKIDFTIPLSLLNEINKNKNKNIIISNEFEITILNDICNNVDGFDKSKDIGNIINNFFKSFFVKKIKLNIERIPIFNLTNRYYSLERLCTYQKKHTFILPGFDKDDGIYPVEEIIISDCVNNEISTFPTGLKKLSFENFKLADIYLNYIKYHYNFFILNIPDSYKFPNSLEEIYFNIQFNFDDCLFERFNIISELEKLKIAYFGTTRKSIDDLNTLIFPRNLHIIIFTIHNNQEISDNSVYNVLNNYTLCTANEKIKLYQKLFNCDYRHKLLLYEKNV